MPHKQRLTYEYVKDFFAKNNCEMIDDHYKNRTTKINYICNCGRQSKITFSDFSRGRRCRGCSRDRVSNKHSFNYEYVKAFFAKNNCEMLDNHYKNARTHINYRCHCGNVSKIIFDSFRRGHRCKKCATELIAKKQTFTLEHVKEYFKEQGCELLEDAYINANAKMRYRCKCGDVGFTSLGNFRGKGKCPLCSLKGRSGEKHYEWVEDRELIKERDKFRQRCYKMLRFSLSQTGQLKSDRTHVMLGYSSNELYAHITSHSNWDKVNKKKWHLDHIFPIKAFADYGIKDTKLINCLENLQPLDAKENCSKNDRYNKEEFEKWLEGKGYEIN